VYDYFCVAPILGSTGKKEVHAWAGILSHVACDDSNFLSSEDRLQWGDDARAGLGIVRTEHWDAAIDDACKSFNVTEVSGAPVLSWSGDPMKTERDAWNTAWLVEFVVFGGYLLMVAVYRCVHSSSKYLCIKSACAGSSADFLIATHSLSWTTCQFGIKSVRIMCTNNLHPHENFFFARFPKSHVNKYFCVYHVRYHNSTHIL
jgi:hypothetical protein